jgi:NAD-dependent deacetylase
MAVPEGLIAALRDASHVCVLTGSGISAESGVPTFREAQTGLWEKYDPHELATPDAFRRDPALVWRWYRWRRELVAGAEPNAGHHALVTLAGLVPQLTIITQNVDGLVCPGCGGMLRPGVVWFGEAIPESAMHAAAAAVSGCELFFSIGTSALVWPAAGLADAARQQGASVVEINLDATPLSSRTDYCLTGKSGSILPELIDCLGV